MYPGSRKREKKKGTKWPFKNKVYSCFYISYLLVLAFFCFLSFLLVFKNVFAECLRNLRSASNKRTLNVECPVCLSHIVVDL